MSISVKRLSGLAAAKLAYGQYFCFTHLHRMAPPPSLKTEDPQIVQHLGFITLGSAILIEFWLTYSYGNNEGSLVSAV